MNKIISKKLYKQQLDSSYLKKKFKKTLNICTTSLYFVFISSPQEVKLQ